MNPNDIPDFDRFLTLFPEVELPITLTTDAHVEFSRHNVAIPDAFTRYYLATAEDDEDFTEYVACFKVPETRSFHAIVYWKAGLLNYEYIMATFDKQGELLDKRSIAGTQADGDRVTRSVATIEADWLINVVEGSENTDSEDNLNFNPALNRVTSLELNADGGITIAEEV